MMLGAGSVRSACSIFSLVFPFGRSCPTVATRLDEDEIRVGIDAASLQKSW